MTKPIHIALTSQFLAVCVRVELQPNGSYYALLLEQDYGKLAEILGCSNPAGTGTLIVCWFGTLAGSCFVKSVSLEMRKRG